MEQHFNDDEMYYLHSIGFPTFDEFKKDPDKWRSRPDDIFKSADISTVIFKDKVKAQKYYWKDIYKFDSLEQIEKVCKEEGVDPIDLEMEPLVIPIDGSSKDGRVEIVIRFWPKSEWAAKGKVITNA